MEQQVQAHHLHCLPVISGGTEIMSEFIYITLREKPQLKETAAEWFHKIW
jgi:hypothetical protein